MNDLFGHATPREPFEDIRNQRPNVAEEKAQLCLALNRLLQTPPPSGRLMVDSADARVARGAQALPVDPEIRDELALRSAVGDQHHAGVRLTC